MKHVKEIPWTPTPSFLYRHYIYTQLAKNLPKNFYFLDVGTGNGYFLQRLKKLGLKGEGIDPSKEAVLFAQNHFQSKEIAVKQADIFTFRTKKKYDVIFCFEALEHINDDVRAIKKIATLLKPNGLFILSVPAHMSRWTYAADTVKGHYRRYERKELQSKIKNEGFTIKKFCSYGFPVLALAEQVTGKRNILKSQPKRFDKDHQGRLSSIQREYNPKMKFIFHPFFLYPIFKFMDLFVHSDWGMGYFVVAKKSKGKS